MNKNNKILILILVALLVALFIIYRVYDPREKRMTFFNIDVEQLNSFEIATTEDTLKITRVNNEWQIEKPFIFPAEKSRVQTLKERILPAQTSETPVSIAEESRKNYLVTEEEGVLVSFFDRDDNLLDRAYTGRRGRVTYVRRPDDNNVYQIIDHLGQTITPNVNPWRDIYVVSFNKNQIQQIDVEYLRNTYSITATDDLWHYEDSQNSFSIEHANRALRRMFAQLEEIASMRFIDFQYDEYQEILADPSLIITITTTDNEITELVFGFDREQGDFVVMKNGNKDHLFLVEASTADRFTISYRHFEDNLQ